MNTNLATQTHPLVPPQPSQPHPPTGILHVLLTIPNALYAVHLGRLLGHRFLLLTHRGRKSGQLRRVVLEVVRYDAATGESIVAAGWGRRTQWYLNVLAGGVVEVSTAGRTYRPALREVEVEEAIAIWADYERRMRFAGPVIRRVLSGLLGWRYDGSAEARRRAAEQLPMLAFKPAR
jgi:deazaflavin-dependent oxidoreductase (nitroreductase family)